MAADVASLERASPVRVVSIAVLLLVVLGSIFFLASPRSAAIDESAAVDALFASIEELEAHGLEPESAHRLPSGERVIEFVARESAPRPGPPQLTVIEYPAGRARAVLEDQFRSLRFDSGEERFGAGSSRGRGRGGPPGSRDGKGDEKSRTPKLQEMSVFDWHGYEANYARLRHPGESEEDSYETVRVNLSTSGRCVIAYLRFPAGQIATKEAAAEIVRSLRPRD